LTAMQTPAPFRINASISIRTTATIFAMMAAPASMNELLLQNTESGPIDWSPPTMRSTAERFQCYRCCCPLISCNTRRP
jgi:hypothetical protein